MRRRWLFLFLACWIGGCGGISPVNSINEEDEILAEDSFEFHYPKDWKISSEQKDTKSGQRITTYDFRHPQAKDCYVRIEIVRPSSDNVDGESFMKEIVKDKVHVFKDMFERSGYTNFSFASAQITLSKYIVTQLVISGDKSEITRKVVVNILRHRGNFYTLTYQWFDSWGQGVKHRLEKIAHSLRFTN